MTMPLSITLGPKGTQLRFRLKTIQVSKAPCIEKLESIIEDMEELNTFYRAIDHMIDESCSSEQYEKYLQLKDFDLIDAQEALKRVKAMVMSSKRDAVFLKDTA